MACHDESEPKPEKTVNHRGPSASAAREKARIGLAKPPAPVGKDASVAKEPWTDSVRFQPSTSSFSCLDSPRSPPSSSSDVGAGRRAGQHDSSRLAQPARESLQLSRRLPSTRETSLSHHLPLHLCDLAALAAESRCSPEPVAGFPDLLLGTGRTIQGLLTPAITERGRSAPRSSSSISWSSRRPCISPSSRAGVPETALEGGRGGLLPVPWPIWASPSP